MPANALIDFLLPTLEQGNWVDLEQAGTMAEQGASVWIADLLTLSENGAPLSRPEVQGVRLSMANDPSFTTFDDALSRVMGAPLPPKTLALQQQLTVDALLRSRIASPDGNFSFTPRFARLGVVVDTAVTFLTPDGELRAFSFQGDPGKFPLNPSRRDGAMRSAKTAVSHFLGQNDYLLFAMCAALTLLTIGPLASFTLTLSVSGVATVLAFYTFHVSSPTLRSVIGVLLAALVVYMGIEAIVTSTRRRICQAAGAGIVMGAAWWFDLRPDLQFAGRYRLSATIVFAVCAIITQALVVAAFAGGGWLARRSVRVPRATIILPAALALHVAWRRFLERADGLALVALYSPTGDRALLLCLAGAGVMLLIVVEIATRRARAGAEISGAR
jgi:hypothetical protein